MIISSTGRNSHIVSTAQGGEPTQLGKRHICSRRSFLTGALALGATPVFAMDGTVADPWARARRGSNQFPFVQAILATPPTAEQRRAAEQSGLDVQILIVEIASGTFTFRMQQQTPQDPYVTEYNNRTRYFHRLKIKFLNDVVFGASAFREGSIHDVNYAFFEKKDYNPDPNVIARSYRNYIRRGQDSTAIGTVVHVGIFIDDLDRLVLFDFPITLE